MSLWSSILASSWEVVQVVLQVGLLAVFLYVALLYLRHTPATPILVGIVVTILLAWVLSYYLELEVIEWLLGRLPGFVAVALVIIFQPELRRALAEIGTNPKSWLLSGERDQQRFIEHSIDELVTASFRLGREHVGALIAIEREIGMRSYVEAGLAVNAPVSAELLMTIFHKGTPMHDGAVIIKDGMVLAANCFFPITEAMLDHELGTRHRAAIGVSEQTDALVIVVSEERGWVSLVHKGRLVRDVDEARLRRHLVNYLIKKGRDGG